MANISPTQITVETSVAMPIEKVWRYWTEPQHIIHWNNASPDWHTPTAENDLQIGGSFTYRMEAKDGSFGFDFGGVYTDVKPHEFISYVMGDDREVEIRFVLESDAIHIKETFDAEKENTVELQRFGWQCILDNFKAYTEMK